MKKLMLSALLIGAFGFTSCGSDDDASAKSCATLIKESGDAGIAHGTDPSVANCNAYKAALQALVDNGTCLEGQEAAAQAAIIALDCPL